MFNILLGIILEEIVIAANWRNSRNQNGRVPGLFHPSQRGLSGILPQGQMFSGSEKAFPSDELVHQGPRGPGSKLHWVMGASVQMAVCQRCVLPHFSPRGLCFSLNRSFCLYTFAHSFSSSWNALLSHFPCFHISTYSFIEVQLLKRSQLLVGHFTVQMREYK